MSGDPHSLTLPTASSPISGGKLSARSGSAGGGGGSGLASARASSTPKTGSRPSASTLALPAGSVTIAQSDASSMLSAGVPLTAKSRAAADAKNAELAAKIQKDQAAERAAAAAAGQPYKAMEEPNVEKAPPPDIRQRQLVFDSLQKIQVAAPLPADKAFRKATIGNKGGTYLFTWGAGYVGQLARKLQRGQKKSSVLPLAIPLNVIVRQVTCGALHTAVVTEAGFVYTWGDAKYGKLGQSKEVLEHDSKTPQLVESLSRHFIVQVGCGRHHTVALTDTGSIWSWGWGKSGQLGHGGRYDQTLPVKIDDDFMSTRGGQGASLIACGDKHTVYISRDGLQQVYSFGCGEHGQTGHGRPENKFEPTRIEALADKRVTQIGCGPIHTGFVTKEGSVYMCGFGEFFYSQASTSTGLKGANSTMKDPAAAADPADGDAAAASGAAAPTSGTAPVMLLSAPGDPVSASAAGSSPTASPSKTTTLNLAATSTSTGGNLASPKHKSKFNTTAMASMLGSSSGVSGGPSTQHTHFAYLPRLIVFPTDAAPVAQIACGQSHNLVLTVTGQVYSWGAGDYGQLGHGIRWSVNSPRLVLDSNSIHLRTEDENKLTQPMRISGVAAGRYHSFALTNAGVLYGWGCNENGQLGIGSEPEKKSSDAEDHVLLPTAVGAILGAVVGQVTCGEHHTAVLTSARWMKLSPDVVFWKQQDDIERDMKLRVAIKSHRPLTKKDLAKIQDELREWRENYERQKDDARKRETEELKAQVNSISYKELDLLSTGSPAAKKSTALTTLPSVAVDEFKKTGEGDSPRTPSKRRQSVTASGQTLAASPSVTRLPSVGKRGQGATQKEDDIASVNSLSPSQAANLSPSQRSNRSPGGAAQSSANGVGSEYSFYQGGVPADQDTGRKSTISLPGSAPVSRSQFLKETATMVKKMATQVTSHHGEVATSKQLNDKIREVFAKREKYDKMRHHAQKLESQLSTMRAEHGLSVHTGSASAVSKYQSERESVLTERLEELTMRLNTVMIKISESDENRMMYLKNIDHLKEETFERMTELTQLRKQAGDADAFYRKFADLHQSALQERDKAVAELSSFEDEISSYRRFVQSQTDQYSQVVQIVQGVHDKRAESSLEKLELERTRVIERADRRSRAELAKAEEKEQYLSKWSSVESTLHKLADEMGKIEHATGLKEADAIVNKFRFKGEVRQQLAAEIDDKEEKIKLLTKEVANLQVALAAVKGDHKENSWRDVESIAEQSREAEQRHHLAQAEFDRLTQRLTHVQVGLLSLLKEYYGVGIHVGKTVAAAALHQRGQSHVPAAAAAGGAATAAGGDSTALAVVVTPAPHVPSVSELESIQEREIAGLMKEKEGKHLWTEEQGGLIFAYLTAGADQLKDQLAVLRVAEEESERKRLAQAELDHKNHLLGTTHTRLSQSGASAGPATFGDAVNELKSLATAAGVAPSPAAKTPKKKSFFSTQTNDASPVKPAPAAASSTPDATPAAPVVAAPAEAPAAATVTATAPSK